MRKSTVLWFFLAVVSGVFLFHTSQKVTDGQNRLVILKSDLAEEEESIRVLQAEWSYLNQPGRLEKLSSEYLDLSPMQGRQFARTGDIPKKPEEEPAITAQTGVPVPVAEPAPAVRVSAEKKPAPATPAAKPVIKPVKTAVPAKLPAPAAKPKKSGTTVVQAPAAKTAEPRRDFGDVMKSLGVD